MKGRIPLFLAVFAALVLTGSLACAGARAQVATRQDAATPMRSLQEQMRANVAQIAPSSERDRWQLNTDMWQLVVSHTNALTNTELELLAKDNKLMETNADAITEPEEQERWRSNVLLWRVYVGHLQGINYVRWQNQLKAFFTRMQGNVADITAPAEKERWQANVSLWQILLDRLNAAEEAGAGNKK